jgi:hypothetical protein
MDRLYKMDRDELVRRMRADFERTMLQVADAVNDAPDGHSTARKSRFATCWEISDDGRFRRRPRCGSRPRKARPLFPPVKNQRTTR